jgi:hypothetical protein
VGSVNSLAKSTYRLEAHTSGEPRIPGVKSPYSGWGLAFVVERRGDYSLPVISRMTRINTISPSPPLG